MTMGKLIQISEATNLAFHSMALIATSDVMLNTMQIAERMQFSKNHLSKVLQVLVKNGYLHSNRGPKGGFTLNKESSEISLLEIYELFEGKIQKHDCVLNNEVSCPFSSCVFGGLTSAFSKEFENYLSKQTIMDISKK